MSSFHTSSPRSVVDHITTSSSMPTSLRLAVHLLSHPFVFSHRSSPRSLAAGLFIACRKPSLLHLAIALSSSSHCPPLSCLLLITRRCPPRPLAAGGASPSQSPHLDVSARRLLVLVFCIWSYTPSHSLRIFTALAGCWSHRCLLQDDLSTSSNSLVVILPLLSTSQRLSSSASHFSFVQLLGIAASHFLCFFVPHLLSPSLAASVY